MAYSYRHLGSNGRLGNQLFQIAGTIGTAHHDGTPDAVHFPDWRYAPYFSVPNSFFADIPLTATDMGRQYLQDVALFASCQDLIFDYFTFSEMAKKNLAETFPNLVQSRLRHRTAVHVRRGDYLTIGDFFPTCPAHYFDNCMSEVRHEFPDTEFLVFTDDPDWCNGHFENHENVHVVSENVDNTVQREMAEFMLMASCDAFIISNSSFSWWATFLSQSAHVYVPERWYNEGLEHLDASLFLLPHWQQRSIDPIGPYQPRHIAVVESPTGLIVTNRRNQSVHHMNSTAALFFELCTGSNPQSRIISLIQGLFTKHGVEFSETDGQSILDDLVSRGIISVEGITTPV